MGTLLWRQDRNEDAEPYFTESLQANRRTLGDDHPHTVISVFNMGSVLWKQQKFTDAKPFFQEALVGLRKEPGHGHQITQAATVRLAHCLRESGELVKAEQLGRPPRHVNDPAMGERATIINLQP